MNLITDLLPCDDPVATIGLGLGPGIWAASLDDSWDLELTWTVFSAKIARKIGTNMVENPKLLASRPWSNGRILSAIVSIAKFLIVVRMVRTKHTGHWSDN